MNKGKKFDIILANPPFNLGEKMLIKWFDIANEICTVQPSTWLLGKKQKKDIVKNVDAWEKTEIESIQGNEFFDAGIRGVIAIQHFIKGKEETQQNGDYDKQITFDGKEYKRCKEINKFSNDELLMEFKNIVEPLYLKDNLENIMALDHKMLPYMGINRLLLKTPNPNWYCMAIQQIRGNKDAKTGLPKDDFYTIISNNSIIINKKTGLYKDLHEDEIPNRTVENNQTFNFNFYLHVNTYEELKNIINYLQTFFVRCCLFLIKNSVSLMNGELRNIPIFNFCDPMFNGSPEDIDIALFKKYNISQDIINHILELIPNYYNLDLNKYKTTTYYDKQERIMFDGKWYKECREIKSYSNDELLVEFYNIVSPLYKNANLEQHLKTMSTSRYTKYNTKNQNINNYILRFDRSAGNKEKGDDFYTLLHKGNISKCIGTYKDLSKQTYIYGNKLYNFVEFYFDLITKYNCENFRNYLMCDFARTCLYLIKNTTDLMRGELKCIPWFDFSDPVFSKSPSEIDDYLFKKYNISDKIRKNIEEILPDYYGIRK